ncbi:S8/S53 family peptidase [Acholeplasma manati]|uniref:S8/S53 family peptidase n=1 Tax=Paracholeplasma manati TaxID=591373 RepID=A0ABT2Y813_9MOLU|nr:S8/S53 family peptidase [Paracholeplasma manati]MCV2232622.1 S8/S53 family peptidase [Paracholeplasma manati]
MKKLLLTTIIVLGMTFSLMVNMKNSVVVLGSNNQEEPKDKIVFEGFNLNQSASTDEIQEEVSENGSDIVTVQVQFDYEFASDIRNRISRRTNIDLFIAEQRKQMKDFHLKMNSYLIQELGLEGYENVYPSSYAPFVDFYFEKDVFIQNSEEIVGEIIDDENVSLAYIQNSEEYTDTNIYTAINTIGAYEALVSNEVSGDGVTIGVLENSGIVERKHPNLVGSNLTVRDEWWFSETISSHATMVASVIGGNTGIARDSRLLSVQLVSSPKEEIDWMLDRGVNIINLSWGDLDSTGVYSSQSAYMDYIVRTTFVTIVAAAGNNGTTSKFITNPGLGYNVITVGASNSTGNYRDDYSSYLKQIGPSKPNIVAPSGFTVPNITTILSGTSFAAPIVTGSIALIMESNPELKVYPEKVMALVASSAKMMSMHPTIGIEGYNEEVGAGLFDYKKTVENIPTTFGYINSTGVSGIYKQVYLYVEYGQSVKASVAWLLNSNNTTTIKLTDYDLRLFDPTGRPVASATSSHNNIEVVQYTAHMPGYYRLQIIQNGALANGSDWVSLSYSIR